MVYPTGPSCTKAHTPLRDTPNTDAHAGTHTHTHAHRPGLQSGAGRAGWPGWHRLRAGVWPGPLSAPAPPPPPTLPQRPQRLRRPRTEAEGLLAAGWAPRAADAWAGGGATTSDLGKAVGRWRRAPSGTTDGSPGGWGAAEINALASLKGSGRRAEWATQPRPMTPPPMEPAAQGTPEPPSTPAKRDSRPGPQRVSRGLRPPPGPAPVLVPLPHMPSSGCWGTCGDCLGYPARGRAPRPVRSPGDPGLHPEPVRKALSPCPQSHNTEQRPALDPASSRLEQAGTWGLSDGACGRRHTPGPKPPSDGSASHPGPVGLLPPPQPAAHTAGREPSSRAGGPDGPCVRGVS